jgi:hypothetical protein
MQANEMLHTITCLKHLLFKEWFSPGTPASSTTKTGRHDIAEILLKVAINTIIHSFNQKKNEGIITGFHISQQCLRSFSNQ